MDTALKGLAFLRCLLSIIGFLVFCFCCSGQTDNIRSTLSPKLRQFLTTNSDAMELFTNVFSEAFGKRRVQIYYFYTDDESTPKAAHYYPSESAVGITVRENQEPLDEFVCIVFEAINSESEKSFQEISRQAQQGLISREKFARDILRLEFNAVLKTRDLLKRLKLNVGEMSKLSLYKHMIECPDTFDDFLAYTKAISPNHQRDPLEDYEKQYDLMQKP